MKSWQILCLLGFYQIETVTLTCMEMSDIRFKLCMSVSELTENQTHDLLYSGAVGKRLLLFNTDF